MKSPAALHGFINGLYKKVTDETKRTTATAVTDAFLFDYRNAHRSFLFGPEDLTGFRNFAMTWQSPYMPGATPRHEVEPNSHNINIKAMGLLDDGRYIGGEISIRGKTRLGSLSEEWIQFSDSEDPHRERAHKMAQFMAAAFLNQPLDEATRDTLHSLEGWQNPESLSIDPCLKLPIHSRGGRAYAHARENERSAHWTLKTRLRNSGIIDYDNETVEAESQHIYSGIHRATSAIMQQERRGMAYVSAALSRPLDEDILKLARSQSEMTPQAVNYFMGQPLDKSAGGMIAIGWDEEEDEVLDEDGALDLEAYDVIPVKPVDISADDSNQRATASERRRQARDAYPALMGHMMRSLGITKRIDTAQPLNDALSEGLDISPAHLKRLQGQTWQRTGRDFYRHPATTTDSLTRAAVDHMPTNKAEWKAFQTAFSLANEWGEEAGLFTRDILKDLNGRYDAIAKVGAGHVRGGVHDAGRHINDHLTRPALIQALHKKGVSEDAITTWIGNSRKLREDGALGKKAGLRSAIESSDRWHRVQARFDAQMLPEKTDNKPWPTPLGPTKIDDMDVVPLNSETSLREEGMKQNHCVGGYASHCLRGQSVIYSLRKNGKIRSTVEFHPQSDTTARNGADFTITQNMSNGNGSAPTDARKAADSLRKTLNGLDRDSLQTWRSDLETESRQRNAQKKTLKDQVGFDPFNEDKVRQAYTLMRPALPKAWARKSYDSWMQDTIEPMAQRHFKELIEKHGAPQKGKTQDQLS